MTTYYKELNSLLLLLTMLHTGVVAQDAKPVNANDAPPVPVDQAMATTVAKPAKEAIDINTVVNAFHVAMQTTPELRGAWLFYEGFEKAEAVNGKTDIHKFRRVFDARNVQQQYLAMNELLAKWLPLGSYSIDSADDQFFPLSELIEQLHDETEFNPQLAGSVLQTAYYEASAGSNSNLNLVFRGLIASSEQAKAFDQQCGELMRKNPVWLRPASSTVESAAAQLWITPSVQSMEVWEGSPDRAGQLYVAGINSYWRGDYILSSQQFRRAVVESPRDLRSRYWQALSELMIGRDDRCARLLKVANQVVGIRAGSAEYNRVGSSLERIQGRTRQILLDMEFQAIFQIAATGRAVAYSSR